MHNTQYPTKPPHGFRSAVAWDADAKAWIAAGTNGSDISYDDGKTWTPLDNGNWNALSLPWIVGLHGRIARLDEAVAQKMNFQQVLINASPSGCVYPLTGNWYPETSVDG